ncbi:cysteine hydrolase family protein [Paenibacillus azoreducens]|uniref:Isochorismatase n=1 Tax=Paenibacillus azoreducens TaxID=116718 RepID=A0A919YAA3_9BACL|nr:cysteine hydrolase family protein [Paenibacillus azoreducens]GIO45438.1 isochorismatase [Paenibacillus azoreducens]
MQNKALLVIDVQAGMFPESDPVYEGEVLLERLRTLLHNARSCGVPVIYVQHNEGPGEPLETGTSAWGIHPSIAPAPEDAVIQKFVPDSFHETNLQEVLAGKGIEKLVIAGIQTDVCVQTTSRRANQLGYEITVAEDAHSTWGQEGRTAAQIIMEYNELFRQFAKAVKTEEVEFC